jgi:hypothetical protein
LDPIPTPTTFSELPSHLCFIGQLHFLRISRQVFYLEDLYAQYVNYLIMKEYSSIDGMQECSLNVDNLVVSGALEPVGKGCARFSEHASKQRGLVGEELDGAQVEEVKSLIEELSVEELVDEVKCLNEGVEEAAKSKETAGVGEASA